MFCSAPTLLDDSTRRRRCAWRGRSEPGCRTVESVTVLWLTIEVCNDQVARKKTSNEVSAAVWSLHTRAVASRWTTRLRSALMSFRCMQTSLAKLSRLMQCLESWLAVISSLHVAYRQLTHISVHITTTLASCLILSCRRRCSLFLNMLTVAAETMSSSTSFNRLTIRSEKKYFLKTKWLLCFLSFNKWPLVLLSVDGSNMEICARFFSLETGAIDLKL